MIIDQTSHKEYMQELEAYQKKKERRSNYNPEERTAEYYLKLGFTLEKAILFASWK